MASRFITLLKSMIKGHQVFLLEYPVDLKPRYGHGLPAHPGLLGIIERYRAGYEQLLQKALLLKSNFISIPDQKKNTDVKSPGWNNGFLPGLDIVMIYTMLVEMKPARYVEIGSGNSTKVAYKAKKDYQLNTKLISIDPTPRTEIDQLVDEVIRVPFEKTDLSIFRTLGENDIVFVDNSHRVLTNSDATVFFMDVLPTLSPGVIVHVHDVYLPYDYPNFMAQRYYAEQYMLAAFLLANPDRYEVIMPNFFVSEDKALNQVLAPVWDDPVMPRVEQHGGSFWFKVKS